MMNFLILVTWVFAGSYSTPKTTPTPQVVIKSAVTPPRFQQLINEFPKKAQTEIFHERGVFSQAILEKEGLDPQKPKDRKYWFRSATIVQAGLPLTRKVLTDYESYKKMISYVQKAEFDAKSQTLTLEGGIWGYVLMSKIKFKEVHERMISYEFIEGHFQGLKGDMIFESLGEKGTGVFMRGEVWGEKWPPAFVIERGAEIVFDFTARKMRNYIQEQKR